MIKMSWKTALCCALLLSCSVCAFAAPRETLTVALRSEPGNLDPHNNAEIAAFAVEEMIFDRLLQKDAKGNVIPMVAEKWEPIDDLTTRFYLRKDIKFHDGTPLTAKDVKYTLERGEVMRGSKAFMSLFDGKDSVIVNDYTIDIKTKKPFAPMFNYLASPRGNIVPAAYVEAKGVDYFGRNPMGSGPCKFVKWVSGDRIELERNETYWGGLTDYKKLVFRVITETASRGIELETGGVDISYYLSITDVERLMANPQTTVLMGPGFETKYMIINCVKYKEMADPRVRKALFSAMDIPGITEAAFNGAATPGNGLFSPLIPGFKDMGVIKYDPEGAKKALDEAGFNYDTVLKIEVRDSRDMMDMAELIQNMWAEVGIKAEVVVVDAATLLADQRSKAGAMITLSSTNASTGDPDHGLTFWKKEQDYYGVHNDPVIFALADKGVAEKDPAKRNAIYDEMQTLCWDKRSLVGLAFTNNIYGCRSYVKDLPCHGGNYPNLFKVKIN